MEIRFIPKIYILCFLLLGSAQTILAGEYTDQAITPIPIMPYDKEQAKLGARLFKDKILSHDGNIACASCHDLEKGGANNSIKSIGTNKNITENNTPSVFNSIFNFKYGWHGQSKNYAELLNYMLIDPTILGNSWNTLIDSLKQNPDYQQSFSAIFNDGITRHNIENALYEHQKSLITPNSRFDQYLKGNKDALTDEEKEGFKLFESVGCISCHQGRNIGGNLYQKLGIYKNYFLDSTVTAKESHTHHYDNFIKVPSLRNVALTAPYFHDGSQATLEEAIESMAIYQLGEPLQKTHVTKIKLFLETLTGEMVKN